MDNRKSCCLIEESVPNISVLVYVTEPGVEPGLGDYEPPVQPYTTPYDRMVIVIYEEDKVNLGGCRILTKLMC